MILGERDTKQTYTKYFEVRKYVKYLLSDLPGSDARRRVAIERCKPCANPHDSGDMPKYLPAGLTQYVLNKLYKKFPPYHVTQDDVSTRLQRLEVEQITGHQNRFEIHCDFTRRFESCRRRHM